MRRRIIFWRHGRTPWNAEQRFQGQTDIALDDVGIGQAARAAKSLAKLHPSRIVSSDLMRAKSTADALGALTGLTVETDPGLRETFAGEWEGLTRTELEERFPGEMSVWSAESLARPGGGENRLEVAERMVAVVDRVLPQLEDGQTLVIATHGGAARAAIGALLELPPDHWAALGVLTNCAWSVLQENSSDYGPAWRLQEYNAISLPVEALADDK